MSTIDKIIPVSIDLDLDCLLKIKELFKITDTRIQDLRSCSRTGDVVQPQHSTTSTAIWYSLEATGHIFLV